MKYRRLYTRRRYRCSSLKCPTNLQEIRAWRRIVCHLCKLNKLNSIRTPASLKQCYGNICIFIVNEYRLILNHLLHEMKKKLFIFIRNIKPQSDFSIHENFKLNISVQKILWEKIINRFWKTWILRRLKHRESC